MATATTNAAFTAPGLSRKAKVQIRLAENVTLDSITNIVRNIGGHYGCLTCGLGGVDLTLSGDPEEFTKFSHLPGVQTVSVE